MTAQPEPFQQPRYVRVTQVRKPHFVEFEFSIGDPTLYVELVLPFEQFRRFCRQQQAQELNAEQAAQVDYDRLKWRFGQPGVRE